ncbi:MAG: acyl-CoA reductase, partial [Clostridia bacterium]|nr:acyl-CoA reductase [Clostridia bacterium]
LTANIENAINGAEPADKTYYGRGTSVTLYEKPELAVSGFYGNIGVSALPEEELFGLLRGKKGYLQTACLIGCTDKIKELALRAGVCRVMKPEDMSEVFPGEGHDGEYELQRYRRIVNIQR